MLDGAECNMETSVRGTSMCTKVVHSVSDEVPSPAAATNGGKSPPELELPKNRGRLPFSTSCGDHS